MIALNAASVRIGSAPPYRRPADPGNSPAQGLTAALVEALGWLEHGILLVDERAQILFASPPAVQLLAERGLNVRTGGWLGRLAGEGGELHRLIARCQKGSSAAAPLDPDLVIRLGTPPLFLQLAALDDAAGAGQSGLVLVAIVDPGKISLPTPQRLRRQFDLTAAEAMLAVEIVKGQGLKACARQRGISETTARTHLHRIFDKTGTRRQAELVHMILTSRLALRMPKGRPT
jgi:DNA-binding CsgD family transcriptional regulator